MGVKITDWNITGKQLCELSLDDFQKKVPLDPGDLFWTHLELLRKCKFVGKFYSEVNICIILLKPVMLEMSHHVH